MPGNDLSKLFSEVVELEAMQRLQTYHSYDEIVGVV
jgi:hypothetical protein